MTASYYRRGASRDPYKQRSNQPKLRGHRQGYSCRGVDGNATVLSLSGLQFEMGAVRPVCLSVLRTRGSSWWIELALEGKGFQ